MPVDHRERAFEAAIEHHLLMPAATRKATQPHSTASGPFSGGIHRVYEGDAARSLAGPRKTSRYRHRNRCSWTTLPRHLTDRPGHWR